MNLRRAAGAAGLALASALGLSGCTLPGHGGNPDDVQAAVVDAVPDATQVVAQFGANGLTTYVSVGLSIPGVTEETPELASIIDATFQSAWASSRIEPASIRLRITADPIPEEIVSGDESIAYITSIDLIEATESLGFDPSGSPWVGVGSTELAKRYGEWKKP